ncbi:hypothetical protein ON010_g533 [Phytophthora cinnamomi]|nr:hypothetical protein ON010_g533 [Phytophthora cinnamomi]
MKFTLPKNAFPVVQLSEDQQSAFIEDADTIVREIVAANDAFIADGGTLQDSQWRRIRTKEGMQVYRQRKKAINQREKEASTPVPVIESPSWSSSRTLSRYRSEISNDVESTAESDISLSSSSGIAGDSVMEKSRPPGVSLMALHGTTDGTLDDCMFGCFIPGDEDWKLRSPHINDGIDDSRVVASIRGPTEDNPYRYLAIKWFAEEHPAVLTGIVQQRDFLILESSGYTRDSKGEKVGYFLMHSVTLRQIPELTRLGIVRGLMSYCYIFRQGKPGKVDIYTRGFFDSRGDMPGRLSVAISAEAALSCVNLIEYAHIKKLMWLMKQSVKHRTGEGTRATCCEACEKSFSKFSLTSSGSGAACSICRQIVCSKCRVIKKMVMDVSDTGSVQHCSLRFCVSCLLKARRQCGWKIVQSDIETTSLRSTTITDTRVYQRGDMDVMFNHATRVPSRIVA